MEITDEQIKEIAQEKDFKETVDAVVVAVIKHFPTLLNKIEEDELRGIVLVTLICDKLYEKFKSESLEKH